MAEERKKATWFGKEIVSLKEKGDCVVQENETQNGTQSVLHPIQRKGEGGGGLLRRIPHSKKKKVTNKQEELVGPVERLDFLN